MNNKLMTMDFIGTDDWSNAVYKCIETGILYKDITLGSENPELYSCGNSLDGEPGFPISSDLEVHFNTMPEQIDPEKKFNYQMLSRLQSDCEYYLNFGNRSKSRLYYGDEKEQIQGMKDLYNSFTDNEKPEWLTFEQILEYEKQMVGGVK